MVPCAVTHLPRLTCVTTNTSSKTADPVPPPPTTHRTYNIETTLHERRNFRERLARRRFREKQKILREEDFARGNFSRRIQFFSTSLLNPKRTETDSRIDWFDDSTQKLNRQANRRETSNWGIRIKSCSRSPLFLKCTCERACAREEKISLSEYAHCTDISFSNLV